MGADVIKVEPPEGAPSRHVGPVAAGADGDPDASLNFWFYNMSKRSVVLDYRTADGRNGCAACCSGPTSSSPGGAGGVGGLGIDRPTARRPEPRLIVVTSARSGSTGRGPTWSAPTWSAWRSAGR